MTISGFIVALYVGMAILVFTTGERVERSGGSIPTGPRSAVKSSLATRAVERAPPMNVIDAR